jgi:hypothetical protein
MKAQMLKIAGVKTEKEFYSKYPSQEAFMKKHGKEFDKIKKAQFGTNAPSFSNDLEGYDPENNYNKSKSFKRPDMFNDPFEEILSPGINKNVNWQKQDAYKNRMSAGITGDTTSPMLEKADKVAPYLKAGTDIIDGLSMIKGQRNKVKEAKQNSMLTGVQADAAGTRDVDYYNMMSKQRRGVRPEDNIFTGEELFPVNGVGTNVLAKHGKNISKAQQGMNQNVNGYPDNDFGDFLGGGGDKLLEKVSGKFTNNGRGPDAGSKIGGGVGQAAGNALFGPLGGTVGKFAGEMIGGFIDTADNKIIKYNKNSERNTMLAGLNSTNMSNSYMNYGGEISSMEEGGELAVGDEGEAELISYNPYMPDNGETVVFNGPSHKNGGINMMYGGNQVEVEGREFAQIVEDPITREKEFVISGNLKIPKNVLGDKNADGKKFKNYIKDLSEQELKQTKILDKTMESLADLNLNDSFDRIKVSSFEAMTLGANLKLKAIADKKQNAAFLQKAINESAEEFGLDADALAKGKHKKLNMNSLYAKNGKNIPMAQNGTYQTKANNPDNIDYNTPEQSGISKFQGTNYQTVWTPEVEAAFNDKENAETLIKRLETYEGQSADAVKKVLAKIPTMEGKIKRAKELALDGKVGPYHYIIDKLITPTSPSELNEVIIPLKQKSVVPKAIDPNEGIQPNNNNNPYITALNSIIPNFRGTDAEPLNPRQLAGEMYAMSNNQLEPVQAQTYQPQLDVPYDISYQDQLNENQADFRSTQRLSNNPAVLSSLNAQKYQANSRVLGEQFRANQGMKDKVYSGNRATLNDAQMKNLSILDNQYTRQAEAKSNAKAVTQAALSSISEKYSQNALENKKLQVYENMYNYRYGDDMKLQNRNGLASFTTPTVGYTGNTSQLGELSEEDSAYLKRKRADDELKEAKKQKPKSRNGIILNATKLTNYFG